MGRTKALTRKRGLLALALIATLTLVAVWLVAESRGGAESSSTAAEEALPLPRRLTPQSDEEPQSGKPAPGQAAGTSGDTDDPEVVAAATELLTDALPVVTEIGVQDEPGELPSSLRDMVSAEFHSEVEAERLEFATEEWTRTGSYQIGKLEVLEAGEVEGRSVVTVRACLDGSDLVVHRADGVAMPNTAPPAWHVFTLEQTGGSWKIAGRTFADDPAC